VSVPIAPSLGNKPKIRLTRGSGFRDVERLIRIHRLHTVCGEARCPNIYECWEQRTATLMILGSVCTRACGFCSVKTGRPGKVDSQEPQRVLAVVRELKLRHVVLTSVDRDDLQADYGAAHWAKTIRTLHEGVPNCTVEVLTPDFRGYRPALEMVFSARPEVFGHNLECVERISRRVRPQSNWQRSLDVLEEAAAWGLITKTGIMLGLGEQEEEVVATMQAAREVGVRVFTIGQYLQPAKHLLPVQRYVPPEEFQHYRKIGLTLGFEVVESGPLVRSSYHAGEQIQHLRNTQ